MTSGAEEPRHAEHFESFAQQAHAARLGMWVFLGSETLLFAGLIGLFWSYRARNWQAFEEAAHHNLVVPGTAMTLILLISSFLVAWSLHSLRENRRRTAIWCLLGTFLLGLSFLALKAYEYRQHVADGIFPGRHYAFDELPGHGAKLFFALYYFLTGLHALHVAFGMLFMLSLALLLHRGHFDSERHSAVENGGLYWHLVDIVWLFLWPMLYLV